MHRSSNRLRRQCRSVAVAIAVAGLAVCSGALVKDVAQAAAVNPPPKCLPITGPNHGSGDQYEVYYRGMPGCDAAVAVFREIVGKSHPHRPNNTPTYWWEATLGWKCGGGAADPFVTTATCESFDRFLAFNPIPQALQSPTTVVIGQAQDGSSGTVEVFGSPSLEQICVGTAPATGGYTKWQLVVKFGDSEISCGFATSWLARMVRQTGRGPIRAMPVAPRGWKCYGTLPNRSAVIGVCRKSGTSGASFGWSPVPNN